MSQMAVVVQAGLALSASRRKSATPLPSRRRRRTRSGPGERALQLNFNNGGGHLDARAARQACLPRPLDRCRGGGGSCAFPETQQASRAGIGRSSVGWRQPRTEAGPLRHFCVGGKSASLFSVGRENAYETRESSSRAGVLHLFISSRGNQL